MYIFIEAITKHKSYVRDANNRLTLARHVKISENYINSYECNMKNKNIKATFCNCKL